MSKRSSRRSDNFAEAAAAALVLGGIMVYSVLNSATSTNDEKLRAVALYSGGVVALILLFIYLFRRKAHQAARDNQEFVQDVARVLAWRLNADARVTGGTGGIDIELKDKSGALRGVALCKKTTDTRVLNPSDLHGLDGLKQRTGAPTVVLATNAKFSPKTHEQAKAWGVTLLDGKQLQAMQTKMTPADPFSDVA